MTIRITERIRHLAKQAYWRFNRIEATPNGGVVIVSEDQGGHPFNAFTFECAHEPVLVQQALEAALSIISRAGHASYDEKQAARAIEFLRENFRPDGAEGETVYRLCELHEAFMEKYVSLSEERLTLARRVSALEDSDYGRTLAGSEERNAKLKAENHTLDVRLTASRAARKSAESKMDGIRNNIVALKGLIDIFLAERDALRATLNMVAGKAEKLVDAIHTDLDFAFFLAEDILGDTKTSEMLLYDTAKAKQE
jgi:hypothetical protein